MFTSFIENEIYADNVVAVVYHSSSCQSPWRYYNNTDAPARFTYYGVTGIPHCKGDGVQGFHPGTNQNLVNAYNARIDIDSPVSIDLVAHAFGDNVGATATVTSGDDAVSGNIKIRFVMMTEFYDDYTGSNGQSEWHWDCLEMAPNAAGTDFSIDANSTETVEVEFNWPVVLDGSTQPEDNIMVACFIQNDSNDEVLQSEWCHLSPPASFTLQQGVDAHYIPAAEEGEYTWTLANTGEIEDTYTVTVDTDLPDGWSCVYTTPDGDQTGGATLTLAAGEEYTSTVTIVTDDAVPGASGSVGFTISSETLPSLMESASFYGQTATDWLVVNGDPAGAYEEFFTASINAFLDANDMNGDYTVGVWTEADFAFDPMELDETVTGLIMWYLGDGGIISEARATELDAYVQNGGLLWVSGSDAPYILTDFALAATMGFSQQARYSAGYAVHGEEEDEFFGHLAEFDIMGGDGADNRRTPCSLSENGGTTCLMYSTIRRAGIRMMTDSYHTLITGFPFEAIASAEERNAFMDATLAYLLDMVEATPEAEANMPMAFSLEQNWPNPFNPSTEIAFGLPVSGHVTLTVFDVTGRQVATLADNRYDAGAHAITWNAGDLASGVYFYQLRVSSTEQGFTATNRMMLLK